jgi:expansin (peptidoglycan-binding protein)
MDTSTIRSSFGGADPVKLEAAISAVEKRVKGPKMTTQTFSDESGGYNSVALDVVPEAVLKVGDASKGSSLSWKIVGQQIIASRAFTAPVVVEYVTIKAHEAWRKEMISAVVKELEK